MYETLWNAISGREPAEWGNYGHAKAASKGLIRKSVSCSKTTPAWMFHNHSSYCNTSGNNMIFNQTTWASYKDSILKVSLCFRLQCVQEWIWATSLFSIDLVREHKLDPLSLCETWLKDNSFMPLNEASHPSYTFAHAGHISKKNIFSDGCCVPSFWPLHKILRRVLHFYCRNGNPCWQYRNLKRIKH